MRKRTIIKIAMVIAISLCCGKSYVKNIKAETDYLNVQGVHMPLVIQKGTNYSIVGTATSNHQMTWIWMGVNTRKLNDHVRESEKNPMKTSYSLNEMAKKINFSTLPEGEYDFSIQGISNNKYYTSYSQHFYVKNKISFHLEGGSIGGKKLTYTVSGFNRTRETKELIVYSVQNSAANTNYYGAEIAVDANGKVVAKRGYLNDNRISIPTDGFVVSGQWYTNQGGYLFTNSVNIGQYVYYNYQNNQVEAYDTQSDYLYAAKFVSSKEKYGTLPTPARQGYTFEGWYTQQTGGNKVTANDTYSGSELYAHWSKVYNPGNGENNNSNNNNNNNSTTPSKNRNEIFASSKNVQYKSKPFYLNVKTRGNGSISYKSSNNKVAVIDKKGKITPKGYGQTTISIYAYETDQYTAAWKNITISVVPRKMILKKVKSPKKRCVKATWKKDSSATGYEMFICKKKNFKSETLKRVYKKNQTSKYEIGYSNKKTYYFKIRAYKMVGKKKLYGPWSATKSVKIK